jgi:NAD(P)-dependent dehydrogenase (short-subunit alcohol dehydrogenase family)
MSSTAAVLNLQETLEGNAIMQNLRDQTAFITGAANGIGLGIAQALAAAGAKVALADIDETALAQATAQLRATGATAIAVPLDVRSRESWQAALDRTEAELGPLRILCSNAGISSGRHTIDTVPLDMWQWTLDVNLNGALHAIQTGVPRMRAHGGDAHIVVTASVGGFLVMPLNGAYSATKAAVVSLCETLRAELAMSESPIGVSVLCPAMVRTNLIDNSERLAPTGVAMGERDPMMDELLRAGRDPLAVGELVVRGIRERRFWLFTHPEFRDLVAPRNAEVLAAF